MRLLSRRQLVQGLAAAGFPAHAAGGYVHILNASTHQRPGAAFRLAVAVLRLGIEDRCRSRVTWHCTDPKAVLPAGYQFGPADDRFESHLFQVSLHSEGRHVITLRDESTGRTFASNVVLVSKAEPKHKLYFGDIHIHSRWSFDGRGDPDYSYIYARDAMNLDFACLTEHDPTDEVWEKVKALAREMYAPGRFATLSAYEWTAQNLNEGHKNVYYRAWEGPVLRAPSRPDRVAHTTSAADLWAKLRTTGRAAMTLPHHPAAKAFPVPWDHYDEQYQRAVEIYSGWGSSESPASPRQIRHMGGAAPGHFVHDALAAGQRLGFVGGSDSHSGRPGFPGHSRRYYDSDYSEWEEEGYTGGFTGIYAEELSREAVFDAIRMRRCYATTGQRIVLDFRADGHWMGEEYRSGEAPHLQGAVIGTSDLESVTLVKNSRDYRRWEGQGREFSFAYDKTEPPRDTDYYYVRVVQRDGEMAWSSPIWVSRK